MLHAGDIETTPGPYCIKYPCKDLSACVQIVQKDLQLISVNNLQSLLNIESLLCLSSLLICETVNS